MLMWMNRKLRSKKGYTLTELIVVVVILGVLAMIAAPIALNTIKSTKSKTDDANAKILEDSVQRLTLLGDIVLAGAGATSDTDIITKVSAELKDSTIPKIARGSTYHFLLDRTTGKVAVTETAAQANSTVELKNTAASGSN